MLHGAVMEQLRRKRGGFRARATFLISQIDKALCEGDSETLANLEEELEIQKNQILTYDEKVQSETFETDEDFAKEVSESSERIFSINSALRRVRSRLAQPCHRENHQGREISANVKQPQLTLPKFEGDPLKWSDFWELFKSAVHDRPDIPASVKSQT